VTQTAADTLHLRAVTTSADGAPASLELTLVEMRPPVLHGDAGLSQKGPEPGNASYYYSLIGLETRGTFTLGDHSAAVTGVSWMDHEFGTSALSANALGWDWFSLQLDDGTALMFARIRTADGGALNQFEGTLIRPDGTHQTIGVDDFTLQTLDQWTSPRTGITYPSGWRVQLPAYDLELTLTPVVRDQEMEVSFVYWEGAVTVAGTLAGDPIGGRGYVELTGYGKRAAGEYQR
jgi:predicted secreted hydrolase